MHIYPELSCTVLTLDHHSRPINMNKLQSFLDTLGPNEEPMGMFYTDEKPLEGFSPDVSDLPTRQKREK